jgi:hypothetical protein
MINGVSYQNSTTQLFDPLVYGQTIGNGDVIEVIASTGVASCSSAIASLTVVEQCDYDSRNNYSGYAYSMFK